MDIKMGISEKHECDASCKHHSSLFQIIDHAEIDANWYSPFTGLLAQALEQINQDSDYYDKLEYAGDLGVRKIDAYYYYGIQTGHRYKAALENGHLVGLIKYLPVFHEQVSAISIIYVDPSHRNKKIAIELVKAINSPIILWQQRKEWPPLELIQHAKDKILITENEKFHSYIIKVRGE